MRGVAKRAEVRVMWGNNNDASAGSRNAVELFERADHVGDMLNHMDGANLPKAVFAKRERQTIQVGDNVCTRV